MPKPSTKLAWTQGNPSARVEPTSGEKFTGYVANFRPPAEWHNYAFGILCDWQDYFESVTDAFAGYLAQYGAVVVDPARGLTGSNIYPNTTAGLQAAISALTVGDKIMVLDNIAVTSPIQITRNNMMIDFHSRVTLSKSGSANALRVSATGVRIKGGRISGFSAGGDIGVLIDAGSDYTMVSEMRFASCDTDISDLNGKGELWANINE